MLTIKLMIVEIEPKGNYILYAKYGLKIYLKKIYTDKEIKIEDFWSAKIYWV